MRPWAKVAGIGSLALLAASCASAQSAAQTYQGRGKHELAAYYWAAHFRENPGEAEARASLTSGIDHALEVVKADFDDSSQKEPHEALGAATRKSEVLSFARALGLKELDAMSAAPELETAFRHASRAAINAVDAAETRGASTEEVTVLLRKALALDPNNPELAGRYERGRASLSRTVVTRHDCQPPHVDACETFAALILKKITQERRELTEIASTASEKKDTELVVRLDIRTSDTDWKLVDRGKDSKKIVKKNKFKEDRKDKKGKKVTKTVSATYEIFERSARATVDVAVEVRGLGPTAEVLYSSATTEVEKDERTYLTFNGDERAVAGKIKKYGTDRSPPTDPRYLADEAVKAVASRIAGEILAKLERLVS